MSRLATILLCFALAFSLAPAENAAAADANKPRPNVLILLADDLRCDGLAALGNKIVKTPHLDQLIDKGFIFRNAYTQGANMGAVCMPSRTMIQTGNSYLRGIGTRLTLAQTIKAAGYASIRSGKFSNNPNMLDSPLDQHLDGETAEGNANNIIAFIQEHAGKKPLFLYMASHEPHDPQYAPASYYKKYNAADIPLPAAFLPMHPFNNGEMTVRDELTLPWPRTKENITGKLARYYASITYFDDQVARVIDAMKQAGQLENTLIIIAGDNGLSLGEHGLIGKQNVYEFGGMHVPLVFSGLGVPKGETHAFVYLMDIYPTLCDVIGAPFPKGLDGKDLWPVIQGKEPKVRDVLFTAYRDVQRAVRDDRWKLIRYPKIDKTQLFDLQNDPHETKDLSADPQQADKVKEMTALLQKQMDHYGDKVPLTVANPMPAKWTPADVKSSAEPKPKKRPKRAQAK